MINRNVPASKLPKDVMERARKIFGPSKAIVDNVAWPYGMSALNATSGQQRELVDWAWERELEMSHEGCFCLLWLSRKTDVNCYDVNADAVKECESTRFDHQVAFTQHGKPFVITNSPYDLDSYGGIQRLARLADTSGVHVDVTTTWYGRGAIGILIWNEKRLDAWREGRRR